jgi:hypothetical protein
MNGLRTVAIVLAAAGIFGLFALAAWVTWRVTRWFRRVHTHLSQVFPGGIPAPRPATATVTYAHMHRRTLGIRRMTSSGPRRYRSRCLVDGTGQWRGNRRSDRSVQPAARAGQAT